MPRTLLASFTLDDITTDNVESFLLVRELGRPTTLDVEVAFGTDTDATNAVGKKAAFAFGYEGQEPNVFIGTVSEVTVVGSGAAGGGIDVGIGGALHAVRFRLIDPVGLLEGAVASRIFQDLDVKEIVTEVLTEIGVDPATLQWSLRATYPKREVTVQYQETSLAFVSRLLEEEGIYYFAAVEEGEEKLVFTDDSSAAQDISGTPEIPWKGALGMDEADDAFVSVEDRATLKSGKVTLRDYDFKRPSLDLTKTVTADADDDLELYDYPGLYVEPAEGERLAQVRLEAERAGREVVDIVADSPRLLAGKRVGLSGSPFDDTDGTYLITRVSHELASSARAGALVARASLIPKDVPFRTPQLTPRPIIEGPQTARVVGPAGAEVESIHTDEHGRCKVKFHWDMGPFQDDKASCWMRVSQLQTSGSMILPRLDWEVIVEFLEGNPDRPLITGKLYNGMTKPPYALPEGKTRTAMRTNSSPGGGGSNEIRLEDRAGGEEIMIKAQKNQTIATANDKKKTVGNNATRTIGGNETIDIGGNQTTKITMGSKVTVGGAKTLDVGGNRNNEVNAVSGLTASGNSTGSVGGNHFEMDGNPLEALLAIATEVAINAAQAAAAQAMDQVNAAIQSRVDQAMAPVQGLVDQANTMAGAMQAIENGDMGAIAELGANAAGMPMPPGFPGASTDVAGGGGEGGATASRGGDAAGGEGGGVAATEGGGGGGGGQSYTEMAGVNAAVDSAIEQGIRGGSAALGEALGLGGGEGGGASAANVDGPTGDAAGIDGADRAKGPGHSIHKVTGSYTETVGSMRIAAALTGIATEIGGGVTETIGAAKATITYGDIASDVGGSKTESMLGAVNIVRADASESATGAATKMVGGVVYDKVKGSRSIQAGAPATLVGAFHKIEAKGSITLKCGASEIVIDGSGVKITSPMTTLLAPKIVLTKDVSEA